MKILKSTHMVNEHEDDEINKHENEAHKHDDDKMM